MQIVIATSLKADPATDQYLELYQLLRDHSRCEVKLLDLGEVVTDIVGRLGSCYFVKSLEEITNSIILLCGYNSRFNDIDSSNKVLYLTSNLKLSDAELSLAPRCDAVVAQTHYSAQLIGQQLAKHGLNTRVVKLNPWFRVGNYQFSGTGTALFHTKDSDKEMLKAIGKPTLELPNEAALPEGGLLACFGNSPTRVLQKAMLHGVPVIASDIRPYNELIVDGFNGYLVKSPDRVAQVVRQLPNVRSLIVRQARAVMMSGLGVNQYVDDLFDTIHGRSENYNVPINIQRIDRKWVVRGREFKDGKVVYFPQQVNSQFAATSIHDPIAVLEYFSGQLFSDVYVFGCEFGEYDATDMQRFRTLVSKIGDRAKKIHFCLDEVPKGYEEFFHTLSIISLSEGLKQVR
jgi:hypothetical protein